MFKNLNLYALRRSFFTTIMPRPAPAIEQTLFVATYANALKVLPSASHVTTSNENVLNVVKLPQKLNFQLNCTKKKYLGEDQNGSSVSICQHVRRVISKNYVQTIVNEHTQRPALTLP
jgi:hypothetical protein